MPRESHSPGVARFATTHWSVVRSAGRPDSLHYKQAMESLCRTYWFPLYAFLRRQGHNRDQAEEYTQAFFARLLEKHSLRLADRRRGKFRSFLLASLKNFLANEAKRAGAIKRGGGLKKLSIDFDAAESQYSLEPADRLTPEMLFEKSWALTVLDRTFARLAGEAKAAGKTSLFDRLKVYLTAQRDTVPYSGVAADMGMSEGAVKVAVHRLKKRYKRLLRDEIAQTVTSEDQVDDEIRQLFRALADE